MKIKNLVLVMAMSILSFTSNAQQNVYKKAGIIKIKDHKSIIAGTIRNDKDVYSISLNDIGKFDGHICGIIQLGF